MDHFEVEATRLGVKATYVKQGLQSLQHRTTALQTLLIHKKLPRHGLNDSVIEFIATELAGMDSNNFPSNAGVGEREGRVFSSLVSRRHFGFAHGIGRSGDIAEVQPKAAGSSILFKLTMHLVAHAMQVSGFNSALTQSSPPPLVLPLATGMSLTMCMLALKKSRPAAEYVIWPRIDQKSCFKSILTAGLKPLIVENVLSSSGDQQFMETDLDAIKALMESYGDAILCVLSTTSCFAPRQPDLVDHIAVLCKTFRVGHVVNNAYGVQCPLIVKTINRAVTTGQVDAVVQSTDKNFLVPVGGAIVLSPAPAFLADLSGIYPGRASMAPILDLFMTLLAMGEDGYKGLLEMRLRMFNLLKSRLEAFAISHGEALVASPRNSISIAVTMTTIQGLEDRAAALQDDGREEQSEAGVAVDLGPSPQPPPPPPLAKPLTDKNLCTFFGSMLFQRCVSGCRVVARSTKSTKISGFEFVGWGSHSSRFPVSYFTAACAIGLTEAEIGAFMERLAKVYARVSPKADGVSPTPDPVVRKT